MLPAMRRARIIELLRRDGMAALKDMSDALGVSVSTLRRDVEYLCDSGHLERTHGGAVLAMNRSQGFEPAPEIAEELESGAKRAIGRRAAELIQAGQTVIFDSGTTTAAAARAAVARGLPFTAFTNDLGIARTLSANAAIQTYVAGGIVRPGSATLIGGGALQSIGRLRADMAFIGTHAITPDALSDTSIELAEIKRAILAAAERVVLLVDSTKIFSRAFCEFGRPSEIDLLVTDARLGSGPRAELAARRVAIELASEAA
jgi:DeoR/GlpR family transcriptional regulator of sugar metabolism